VPGKTAKIKEQEKRDQKIRKLTKPAANHGCVWMCVCDVCVCICVRAKDTQMEGLTFFSTPFFFCYFLFAHGLQDKLKKHRDTLSI